MAESEVMLRRVPSRSSWQRVRKARPHLLLSRRGRRRFGVLTRGELRRLRRRLLRAHALGGDWKLGVPAGAHVAVKCKIRTRSRPASRSQPTPSVPPVPCTRVGSCSLLNPRNHSTPQSRAGRPVLKVSPNITQPTLDLGSGRVLLMLPPGEVSRPRDTVGDRTITVLILLLRSLEACELLMGWVYWHVSRQRFQVLETI